MAERGIDQNEEKKSYSSIFVIGIGLLVAFSLWAFWDDNITRRPWKAFQSRFYRLDYAKAQAAYDEENKKLQADANYQELAKKLAAAQASVTRGELGQKFRPLSKTEEVQATVRFQEIDQEVKFIKSELEEAGMNMTMPSSKSEIQSPIKSDIQQLEKARAKLDPELEAARAKRDQIKEEIKKIHGSVKDLEDELGKLTAERDKWVRVMENATFKLGPVLVLQDSQDPASILRGVRPQSFRSADCPCGSLSDLPYGDQSSWFRERGAPLQNPSATRGAACRQCPPTR